ncbi:MAG TPA: VWA domain-containing protein [Chloroflexia bacterium]|nr:VWA domain-containing protein [Chloroflexia bacterium]
MTFIWPVMLVALLLLPLLVGVYVRMLQRRRRLVSLYGDPALLLGQTDSRSSGLRNIRRHVPWVLFLAAVAILIVGLARPQAEVSLPRVQGTIILAFDVSASMSGDDIKPTRLDAAKAAARAFVERQPPGVDIGVVTFSQGGFVTQAPTDQQDLVVAAIDRLRVQSGTSVGGGIEAALKSIELSAGRTGDVTADEPPSLSNTPTAATPTPLPKGTYTSAAIVLITDGENNSSPNPMQAAKSASDRGVRIYTVGVGSTAGATIHLDGFSVRSRLDEGTLKRISDMTGGTYYNAQTEKDLQAVYEDLSPELVMKAQNIEVTALFVGAGIFMLIIGSVLSLVWLGRLP